MEKLSKGLDEVDRKVEGLKRKFEKTTTEAAKLKIELEKAQETITAAENLVGKLDGEYQRWSAQVMLSSHSLNNLFLAKSCVSHQACYLFRLESWHRSYRSCRCEPSLEPPLSRTCPQPPKMSDMTVCGSGQKLLACQGSTCADSSAQRVSNWYGSQRVCRLMISAWKMHLSSYR